MIEKHPIRVLIVDDHAMVRQGLAIFLDSVDDLKLVGEAASGEEAVALCAVTKPDVVLMDLVMPGMDGIAATRAVREVSPSTQVVALTSYKEEERVRLALQAGAIGYLLKNASIDDLAHAIRSAHTGRLTLSPEATAAIIGVATRPPAQTFYLTQRQREVLALIVEGLTNRQIAQRLGLSYSTAKFHVSSILSKLGAASRTEAVALALQHHLVT